MIASVKHKFTQYNERRKRLNLVKDISKNIFTIQSCRLSRKKPVVLCLFKNGEYFLKSFLEHYLKLGFIDFVFIDNCSSDNSLNILKAYDVTVLQSELPYSKYKWAFKQYLVHEFGESIWSLYVDVDELWEYPGLDKISLNEFFNYLDTNGYNASMSMMLDMFADTPICELNKVSIKGLKNAYPFYDNSSLQITKYHKAYNITNHKDTNRFAKGVHKQFFDVDNIYLSKIPLIKWNPSISVHETSHESTFVNIADVSCILLHYKFVKGFEKKIAIILKENNYWNSSAVYSKYANVIKENPELNLKTESAKLYKNPEQLESEKVVWIGDAYKKIMNSKKS
tara:strand:+ start:2269 stop:3285 length:1017 start_codon:yes stop_codon:yes gene_type:complete